MVKKPQKDGSDQNKEGAAKRFMTKNRVNEILNDIAACNEIQREVAELRQKRQDQITRNLNMRRS
jgi:hypothetical protein